MRTAPYEKDAIAKVVQLRANVEGLKLGDGVLERLAQKGHDSSLRSDCYSLIRGMCIDTHIIAQICTATAHARVDPRVNFWAQGDPARRHRRDGRAFLGCQDERRHHQQAPKQRGVIAGSLEGSETRRECCTLYCSFCLAVPASEGD